MFKHLSQIPGNVVAIRISGEIRDRENEQISRILEKEIAKSGRIRLLLVMDHYPSFNTAESLYDDLKFAKFYSDAIERMAVIGDKPWKKTWVALFGLFGGIQAEYFDRSAADAAWKWLSSG
ncbi:STAS/SEC14 domain-containing protein [Desulfonema ishimotonii]|uniref:STAS/SEC14 domain-containing protein n=1 Tax=Desulfonema ishimotonii TaxID=45657 RepID=A0A401FVU6_9BACT|nr:STAS/SEC14 domain-containing protein [Desulfonema ishimotonii]GBC61091.1 STAS/SEC14 domain-containing protein [Desulfonema ishimotonii]